VITNLEECEWAENQLRFLEERLAQLQGIRPTGVQGLAKASMRRRIARLHEELAMFEGLHAFGLTSLDYPDGDNREE